MLKFHVSPGFELPFAAHPRHIHSEATFVGDVEASPSGARHEDSDQHEEES
jgi:hypothetical protein